MTAKDDNLSLYNEYNKTLRAWLVAFGFGVPSLFIINEAAQKKLLASPSFHCIINLFLVGAAAQVFLAFLNKTISWCAYYKHSRTSSPCIVRCLAGMENWFFLDVACDLVSLATFSWSIHLVVGLY